MAQTPRELTPHASLRHFFGAELRQWRLRAGLSHDRLGKQVNYSGDTIGKVEKGERAPTAQLAEACDQALGTGGVLVRLFGLIQNVGGNVGRSRLSVQQAADSGLHAGTGTAALGGSLAAATPMMRPRRIVPELADEWNREDPRASSPEDASTGLPVELQVAHVHRCYQAAEYRRAAQLLPVLTNLIDAMVTEGPSADRREALMLRCSVAIAAAKLATRAGNASLAWLAAERAETAAREADDPFGQAAAAYQRACAFLKAGGAEQAELVALEAAEAVRDTGPQGLTWRGSLMLISAIIAARRHDPVEAADRLDLAEQMAERLGVDGNLGWTAFGPTNVCIHRVSAAAALDDPATTLALADQIDVAAMPAGLRGRRTQVHLESAWAHVRLNQEPFALLHLLDAERIAPQIVYQDPGAHALIEEMLAREHRLRVPSLRGLARRAGMQR